MTTRVLDAEIQLAGPPATEDGVTRATAMVRIEPTEPVFAGHYPDFPILPGVCLLECVRQGAILATPTEFGELRRFSVESARFVGPVFAGDSLRIELELSRDAGRVRCRARVHGPRGVAAQVRLNYATGTNATGAA